MRLTATIVAIEDASRFNDSKHRVVLKIREADSMYRELRIPVQSLDRIALGTMMDVNIPSLVDDPVLA